MRAGGGPACGGGAAGPALWLGAPHGGRGAGGADAEQHGGSVHGSALKLSDRAQARGRCPAGGARGSGGKVGDAASGGFRAAGSPVGRLVPCRQPRRNE